jgi:hypothetical protein
LQLTILCSTRLDDIVTAVGGDEAPEPDSRLAALQELAAGEITHEEALRRIRG